MLLGGGSILVSGRATLVLGACDMDFDGALDGGADH